MQSREKPVSSFSSDNDQVRLARYQVHELDATIRQLVRILNQQIRFGLFDRNDVPPAHEMVHVSPLSPLSSSVFEINRNGQSVRRKK